MLPTPWSSSAGQAAATVQEPALCSHPGVCSIWQGHALGKNASAMHGTPHGSASIEGGLGGHSLQQQLLPWCLRVSARRPGQAATVSGSGGMGPTYSPCHGAAAAAGCWWQQGLRMAMAWSDGDRGVRGDFAWTRTSSCDHEEGMQQQGISSSRNSTAHGAGMGLSCVGRSSNAWAACGASRVHHTACTAPCTTLHHPPH